MSGQALVRQKALSVLRRPLCRSGEKKQNQCAILQVKFFDRKLFSIDITEIRGYDYVIVLSERAIGSWGAFLRVLYVFL